MRIWTNRISTLYGYFVRSNLGFREEETMYPHKANKTVWARSLQTVTEEPSYTKSITMQPVKWYKSFSQFSIDIWKQGGERFGVLDYELSLWLHKTSYELYTRQQDCQNGWIHNMHTKTTKAFYQLQNRIHINWHFQDNKNRGEKQSVYVI